METLFWVCFLIGIVYTVAVVIFGDALAGALDASLEWLQLDNLPVLQPLTLISGLTIFGGSGIVLLNFSLLSMALVITFALVIAVIGVIIVYFVYIKPMANAENSTGYSIFDLVGKEAQVVVPIPSNGYGEVIVKTAGGISNHTAASYDQVEIVGDQSVVVIEVKEGVLFVSPLSLD
ncbi:protease [Paenibacillus septentrionalis]|uniref:Protease n=1 Tax=Paenibacillus septentrionalis TaxID=429342 RepID=A0ABW1V0C9_9BACL